MTDDQGIGDLSCHGNPWLKTPNIDAFHSTAVRMTDFHVSPVCTPTRSAIMTGLYPINNGAWATYKGRDALHGGSLTMPQIFRDNGYRTGIFGKWHLGDNYPVRATDCGFDLAIHHKAGGVGELSDYWGNNYFDDTYYVNNEPKSFQGYCTDVWFAEAMKFIDDQSSDKPFFAYIPTNAPHSPFIVDEKYAAPYKHLVGEKIVGAEFYGMLANIDENFGKLEVFLKARNLADNTILIFMTDNGSGGGMSKDGLLGHNKGYRGSKGNRTEGGHRVPFFIRWNEGNIYGGKDIDELTAHVDLLPTLARLCDLSLPINKELDGVDFSPLLYGSKDKLSERTVFVHNRQDWRPPLDSLETCIMTERWRLVNGELYDIERDKEQKKNLAAIHPDTHEKLMRQNKQFVKAAIQRKNYQEFSVNTIGSKSQQTIKLTIQHAIGEGGGIWKAEHVAEGRKNVNNTHSIKVEKDGKYLISCRRWPVECPGPILGVPSVNPKGGIYTYKTIEPEKVRIQIANQIIEKEIHEEDVSVDFELYLERGNTFLVNDFVENGERYGVYYTYIQPLNEKLY